MFHLVALLLLPLAGGPASAASKPTGPAQAEVQRFMNGPWTEVRRLADVDAAVLGALHSRIGGAAAISDPGGPFDAGDVATNKPTRRLVVAGQSTDRWFVCYEQGGLGHHLVFVIFETAAGKASPVLVARGGGKPDPRRWARLNVKLLRRALRSGDLRVDPQIDPEVF